MRAFLIKAQRSLSGSSEPVERISASPLQPLKPRSDSSAEMRYSSRYGESQRNPPTVTAPTRAEWLHESSRRVSPPSQHRSSSCANPPTVATGSCETAVAAATSLHPAIRPQFGPSWQQNFVSVRYNPDSSIFSASQHILTQENITSPLLKEEPFAPLGGQGKKAPKSQDIYPEETAASSMLSTPASDLAVLTHPAVPKNFSQQLRNPAASQGIEGRDSYTCSARRSVLELPDVPVDSTTLVEKMMANLKRASEKETPTL